MIGRSVSFFNSCLVRWPLKTQMITGGTLTFLGDVICQNFIENTNKWDHLRSLRMGGFAVCVWSTVGYKWILLAEKWFPGRSAKSLFYKILIDQDSFIGERTGSVGPWLVPVRGIPIKTKKGHCGSIFIGCVLEHEWNSSRSFKRRGFEPIWPWLFWYFGQKLVNLDTGATCQFLFYSVDIQEANNISY